MSLRSWARSLFTPAARRSRPAKLAKYRPRGESLESRLALAGNVAAFVSGPNLFITGDNLGNSLRIEGNGTGVDVLGTFGTAVNGVNGGEFNARNIQNIFMEMGNGDDTATFVLTQLTGMLRFSGGNDNDALLFGEGNNGQNSFGSLQALMGDGFDTVDVDSSETHFSVPGPVTVLGGEGGNTTYFRATTVLTLGAITVTGGNGNDDFQIIGGEGTTATTGFISVLGGNGNNNVELNAEVTVNGGISFVGGNNFDYLTTEFEGDLTVNGSIVAALGEGPNTVSFDHNNTVITGAVSVTGGAGVDRFNTQNGRFDALAVSLFLGAGSNVAIMSGTANNIYSSLSITTLGGFDVISVSNLDVRGATTVNTGDELDIIAVGNSRFRSVVTVLAGGGDDTVSIESDFSDDGIGTRFDSTVSIDLGAGLDSLSLGTDADDFVRFVGLLLANGGSDADTLTRSIFNVHGIAPTFISFP